MNRQDWVLLAAHAARGKALSPVQLQKALFLLQQELPEAVGENYYDFRPYNYGPFDAHIYSDAQEQSQQGLLVIEPVPGQRWSSYSLTPAGEERAQQIAKEVNSRATEYLSALAIWMQTVSFQDLLRAVYAKYPHYAANSVFRG